MTENTINHNEADKIPQDQDIEAHDINESSAEQKQVDISCKSLNHTNQINTELVTQKYYVEEDIKRARQEGIDQAAKEMEIVMSELDSLEQQLSQERRERQSLEAIVAKYKKELQIALEERTSSNYKTLKLQHTQLLIDYSNLESSFKELQNRYQDSKSNNEKLKQIEAQLMERLNNQQNDLEKEKSKVEKLRMQVQQQKQTITSQTKKMEEVESQKETKINEAINQLKQLQKSTFEKEKRISSLSDINTRLESELNNAHEQLKTIKKQSEQFQEKNEALEKECMLSKQKKTDIEMKCKELTLNILEAKEQNKLILEKNEELQTSLHKFYEENQALKAKLYDKENEILAIQSRKDSAWDIEKINHLKEIEKLRAELSLMNESYLSKEKENRELMQICDELLQKLEAKEVSRKDQTPNDNIIEE